MRNILLELTERFLKKDSYQDAKFQEILKYYYNEIKNNAGNQNISELLQKDLGKFTIITEPLYMQLAIKYLRYKKHRPPKLSQVINII